MAARAARLLHPMRCRSAAAARVVFRTLRCRNIGKQSAAVEGFDGGRRKAAHAEQKSLQGGARVLGFLQHQYREVREAQLTGEKQPDGTGAGNHDVIDQRKIPRRLRRYRVV
jgi:hypothetical protein